VASIEEDHGSVVLRGAEPLIAVAPEYIKIVWQRQTGADAPAPAEQADVPRHSGTL